VISPPLGPERFLLGFPGSGGADRRSLLRDMDVSARTGTIDSMALEHDDRPWGSYDVLVDADDHKVKTITVLPGKRLSYQRHEKRGEIWVVARGTLSIVLEGETLTRNAGESIDVPRGAAHRMVNNTDSPVVVIEVQYGDYFGEDDIERLEDDFGRADA
jgi:mannose-6-phosphate isomerase